MVPLLHVVKVKSWEKEPAGTIDGLQITSEQRTEDTIEALLAT